MCGLVGYIGDDVTKIRADGALSCLYRRGPDGSSSWLDKNALLGHTRLAIIDLSDAGQQPLLSNCGNYVIVFNGEIYNHNAIRELIGSEYDWKTSTDTEVVLASFLKWGVRCLIHFRGMFAFAIWDRAASNLFAARDRLGVKPFFYRHTTQSFAFASRPDVLRVLLPNETFGFDFQAVRYYLEAGYVPAPLSIYKNVCKLEPGHYLWLDHGQLKLERYWMLDDIESDVGLAKSLESDLLDELDEIVSDSVRLRMVSDVPIGAFLSGGIDSSLVTACMSKYAHGPVKTFTIGFESPDFDESEHASMVARHLGAEHYSERLSPDSLLDLMPDFLSQYDEPFFDYSAFPVMAVSRLARRHVKVALSGDGGDEAFGGYHYYQIMQLMERFLPLPRLIRQSIGAVLRRLPQNKLVLLGELLRRNDLASAFAFMRSVIKHHQILSKDLLATTNGLDLLFSERASLLPSGLSGGELGMRLDIAYTLPDDYLQKVDLGSMAFSLEARDPLLDHTIFEWAAKLPSHWKMKGKNSKYLLRKLAYRYIPRDILDRPKMGFGVPMASWLRGPLNAWAQDLFENRAGMLELGLNPEAVISLWKQHLSGAVQAHTTLWSVLVILAFSKSKSNGENGNYFN